MKKGTSRNHTSDRQAQKTVPAGLTLGPSRCTTKYPRGDTSRRIPLNPQNNTTVVRDGGVGKRGGRPPKEKQPNKDGGEGRGTEAPRKQPQKHSAAKDTKEAEQQEKQEAQKLPNRNGTQGRDEVQTTLQQ